MAANPKAFGGNILMAIDPGFDATKVCVNGLTFKIPACVIDITGKLGNYITKKKDGYILSRYIEGKECLVGEHAVALLMEPDVQVIRNEKSGMIESYEKFETEESQINIMTAIGMALIKYEALCKEKDILPALDLSQPIDENSPLTIFVGVALPHDALEDAWKSVKRHIVGHHEFQIETDTGVHNLNFTIDSAHCMANSQVVEAFLGSIMDDTGRVLDAEMEELPALVIDGGQKTVGDFKFIRSRRVEQAESNTDFAMDNIYKKVAKTLNEEYGRTDIKSYNIRNILEENDGKLVYENNDNTAIVDVKAMVEAETDEMFKGYIDYLNQKYNKLLDIKRIFVYGGTGAAYYERLCNYVANHKEHLRGKVSLADYQFMGRSILPVEAVSVGTYKTLHQAVDMYENQQG